MPEPPDRRTVAIVTACMRREGLPSFALTTVEVTLEEIANGVHYYFAEADLLEAGFEEPFVHFDADEAPAFLHPAVRQYLALAPIRQSDIEAFVHCLEGFREELVQAEAELNAVYEEMKNDARQRLGRLYNPADYPPEVRGLFTLDWDFPSVEPPSYLMRLNPEIYQQEQERISRRFEEAVQLAEQAFVSEFARLVAHLTERLVNGEDGERRVFRNSAVTNLTEFFERFKNLNVRSNQDLDALVEQAQELVRGITPQDLRDDNALRQEIATEMAQVQTQLEGMIVERPRRQIIRSNPSRNGGNHATGD